MRFLVDLLVEYVYHVKENYLIFLRYASNLLLSNFFYRKFFISRKRFVNDKLLTNFSLYFANSGLHTHLNLLNTGRIWWTFVVLVILASVAKIVPVTVVSKLCLKKPWFYCLSIGVLMNTRGIVQLIVLNIGVELGVISPKLFAVFVLMATFLTFLTSPILSLLYRRKYDTSVSKIAEDIRNVQIKEINMTKTNDNNIQTISNDDIYRNPSTNNSNCLLKNYKINTCPDYSLMIIKSYQTNRNINERRTETTDHISNVFDRSIIMTRI